MAEQNAREAAFLALAQQAAVFVYTTLLRAERVPEAALLVGLEWLWTQATGRQAQEHGVRGFLLQGLQAGEFLLVGLKGDELTLTAQGKASAGAYACAKHAHSKPCHFCAREHLELPIDRGLARALKRHDEHVIAGAPWGLRAGANGQQSALLEPRNHCTAPGCLALPASPQKLAEAARALREPKKEGTETWPLLVLALRMILWDPDACAQPDKAEDRAVAQLEDGTYSQSDRAEVAELILGPAEKQPAPASEPSREKRESFTCPKCSRVSFDRTTDTIDGVRVCYPCFQARSRELFAQAAATRQAPFEVMTPIAHCHASVDCQPADAGCECACDACSRTRALQ